MNETCASAATPVALITGGGSGIGARDRPSAPGARPPGRHHRPPGRAAAQAGRRAGPPGRACGPSPATPPTTSHVAEAVQACVSEFGRLDCRGGQRRVRPRHDDRGRRRPRPGWREMVLTNVLGPALLIRAALAALKADGRADRAGGPRGGLRSHSRGRPLRGRTKWAVTATGGEHPADGDRRRRSAVTLVSPGAGETTRLLQRDGERRAAGPAAC